MGRPINPRACIPAAICDKCGRACLTRDQAGAVCFHCFRGVFMHCRWWHFVPCPDCEGIGKSLCDTCNHVGHLVFPSEDFDLGELARELIGLPLRYQQRRDPVPALIAKAAQRGRAMLAELEPSTASRRK